jgi:N-acyl-D-amino-acid deacylase
VDVSLDLLLEDARIIDGTGAPWFHGSVGIKDGRIETVSREASVGRDAAETVDLDGLSLSPGFIDLHSHSNLRLFPNPELEPKTMQGVTTEILGQDGFSMAPMYREGGAEEWENHLSGLDGRAEREWKWGSTTDYFDAIDQNGVAPNMAMLVGHGTVRYNVVGMDDRLPTDEELEEMADLVTEALEAGAIGFSTGLIYTPHTNSDTHEVQTLASRLADYGRPFVAHIRNERNDIWNALDEFVDIGAEEGIPLHLSHFKTAGSKQHGRSGRAIELLEAARERGVDITADQYPYRAGSTMLASFLPSWARAEGSEATLEYLRNSRSEIRDYLESGTRSPWEDVFVTSVATEANEGYIGMSIEAIAEARDEPPSVTVMDILLEEELEVEQYAYHSIEDDVRNILQYERAAVATDGLLGGEPHPRTYGTYPRVLGHYAREENMFSTEEAIRMMTSLPARVVGLEKKGVISEGKDADLVAFDPVTVGSPATYENPRQFPNGMPHVLVDGEFVVRDSEHTGATPGSTIRK